MVQIIPAAARCAMMGVICYFAYDIRLFALKTYGRVIHEFDPWFNFRATQYLDMNGWDRFFKWFDYMSWYPLGRPVGSTIYPGMQITAVYIKKALLALGIDEIGETNNEFPFPGDTEDLLNDICCLIPAWFGTTATIFLGLLTWECSGSANAAVAASFIMSVVPAHIMRSVAGGYDNESIALTAMTMTFWLWCCSLRSRHSWPIGILTGLAYTYMVAVWGGYIFVVNMIGLHAGILVLLGRFSTKLHLAYTLFFVVGTFGATRVPVVGLAPVKSLEQMMPLLVFIGMQVIAVVERWRTAQPGKSWSQTEIVRLYAKIVLATTAVLTAVVIVFVPSGYFGPLSSRVRGLFVRHTRTGNPLVDSVAEHQPASASAYWQFLQNTCYLAPFGWVLSLFKRNDKAIFLSLYGVVAYFFSSKMSRLIILLGPIAAGLGGLAAAAGLEWSYSQFFRQAADDSADDEDKEAEKDITRGTPEKKGSKGKRANPAASAHRKPPGGRGSSKGFMAQFEPFTKEYNSESGRLVRKLVAAAFTLGTLVGSRDFFSYSQMMAEHMSGPSIMYQARLQSGKMIIVYDYREAYWWLRDNTPADSRVMAWWDYGYQITGIANRTTIADGNTWNHEHIATLGRALTSSEKKAHKIVRHLADYVLVWAGGGGDDLAKSPHMARIGTSVYDDICPDDPTCKHYGFLDQAMTPTPMMEASLLYKLHSQGMRPGVKINPELFEEAFTSKYGKVRIYKVLKVSKKSKAWVADPANRRCDAPGSWYCVGQYPPALDDLMSKKKAFAQLEDFNVKKDERSKKHYEQYMKAMEGKGRNAE